MFKTVGAARSRPNGALFLIFCNFALTTAQRYVKMLVAEYGLSRKVPFERGVVRRTKSFEALKSLRHKASIPLSHIFALPFFVLRYDDEIKEVFLCPKTQQANPFSQSG